MMRRTTVLILGIMACASFGAFAEDAVEIVRRSQTSDRSVSYRGIKTAHIVRDGRETEIVFKIVHLKPDNTRTEYYSPELLAGRIVVSNGADTWRYSPSTGFWENVRCSHSFQRDALSMLVLENFSIKLVGTDSVAGRPTHIVQATPRLSGEASRRLWIDQQHYLLMRTQVEADNGQVVSSSRFKSIEFNPRDISLSLFEVPKSAQVNKNPGERPPFSVRKPRYIPAGYKLLGINWTSAGNMRWYQLQYSNGANTISIFQRKPDSPQVEPNDAGRLHNVYVHSFNNMRFTLIGVVPVSELRKMAESIR